AYYLMGASIIGIVSVLALRETSCKPLLGSGPCVATHAEAMSLIRGAKRAHAEKKRLELVRERA
ncbi:hypothetical protein CA602_08395, partial [Paraburkholderia hospita]